MTFIVVNAINGFFLGTEDSLDGAISIAERSAIPCHVVEDDGMIAWDAWEPPANSEYDELMTRRKLIHGEWMKRVFYSKTEHGSDVIMFWGSGPVLAKDGTLQMTAYALNSWDSLWMLEIKPGSTVVTEALHVGPHS